MKRSRCERKKHQKQLKNKKEKLRQERLKETNLPIVFHGVKIPELQIALTTLIKKIKHTQIFRQLVKKKKSSNEEFIYTDRPECYITNIIFGELPIEIRKKYFHTFRVHFTLIVESKIHVVLFRNRRIRINDSYVLYMRSQVTSDHKYIGFTKHMLQRAAERLGFDTNHYFGYEQIYGLFFAKIEDVEINGRLFLKIWLLVGPGVTLYNLALQILGKKPSDNCHFLFGYCPTVLQGNILLAKTLNPPGYCGTPERRWYEKHHGRLSNQAVFEACCYSNVEKTNNCELLKLFHDNGFLQFQDFTY